jgi:predicted outer membrane repeat protein
MFDGAALVTGAEVVQDTTAQDQTVIPGIDGETSTDSNTNDSSDSDAHWFSGLSLSAPSDRKEIVFIDTSVEDYQALLEGIDPNADVILLDSTRDGIEQMAQALNGRTDIDAIHLIAEGNEAELHLGTSFLTQEAISGRYANLFTQIGQSLSADADLLIYGCNFGQGEAGQDAMESLAELTGADIAASTDRTGHVTEYADWELEVATGTIETSIAIGEATQAAWEGALATYTVTTTTDGGAGSLRQAIIDANTNSGTDTITFVGNGTYTLTLTGTGEDAAATGDLDITDDLILIGNGTGSTVIDGGGNDRVFHLLGTSTATMSGITIQSGSSGNDGGGIWIDNSSVLNISDAILTGNDGDAGSGGGEGGAVHVHGTLNANRVLFSGNTAKVGGAIHFHGAIGGSLTNVTISGNTSSNQGGGIWTDTPITLTNSTVTLNSANDAGGISANSTTVIISNTIVSGNIAPGGHDDVRGDFSSDGFNLIEVAGSATGFGSDITGVSANLGVLADNGGPTETHALLAGSLAIDAGTAAGAPAVDQRGVTRDANIDIGAFELTSNAPPTVDLDADNSSGATGNGYQVTFTEGDAPTAIADTDTNLVDVDSSSFASVKLTVSGLLDGNAEVLVLDGDTFALATGVPGQDTSGGNYHVVIGTGVGTATVTITKQGGGLFTEGETETLIKAVQYQHTEASVPTDGNRLLDVVLQRAGQSAHVH